MERWMKLLGLLSETEYITGKKLSEQTGVSKRTIFNDISYINEMINEHGANIVTRPHFGSKLEVSDRERFDKFLALQQESALHEDSSKTRARSVIIRMISAGGPVKFDDLCEEMFISRSTLKKDLKLVRSILKKYDLEIESAAYKGSRIVGAENNVRRCLTELNKNILSDSGRSLNKDMTVIANILRTVFKEHRFRMPEYIFNNLVIHIYIAIIRIRRGYILEAAEGYEKYTDDAERQITEEIISEIENTFGVRFPGSEFGHVMLHLESKKISESRGNSVVTADIYEVVTEMLKEIDSMFHYDFKYDFELISMLATHLVALKVRMLYNMPIENPLIDEIREGALLAYEMANVACSKMVERYGKNVTRDEKAYVALHFHLAIERYREKHKKNVLLVCGTGRGSAALLSYNIEKEFGDRLNVIATHESTDFSDVDFNQFDYILTTVHIEEPIPVPIIEVNSIRGRENRRKLDDYLHYDARSELLQFFDRNRFLPHMKGIDKNDVLRQLCTVAVDTGMASEHFYEHVLKREELGATSFGNMIAIPHPYRPEGEKSFVVTGILDEPILWDQEPVRIVFLLSMKEKGDANLQLFYKSVGSLLSNQESVAKLIREQDFETLITVLDVLREN